MNEKTKRRGREEIFEVFRPHGDHDVSAENYLLKKPSSYTSITGPLRTHHITDADGALSSQAPERHALNLSDNEGADSSSVPVIDAAGTDDDAQAPTRIRLETFRIDMQERLSAMRAAQQKAKDQLNELKKQNPPTDEPLAE